MSLEQQLTAVSNLIFVENEKFLLKNRRNP